MWNSRVLSFSFLLHVSSSLSRVELNSRLYIVRILYLQYNLHVPVYLRVQYSVQCWYCLFSLHIHVNIPTFVNVNIGVKKLFALNDRNDFDLRMIEIYYKAMKFCSWYRHRAHHMFNLYYIETRDGNNGPRRLRAKNRSKRALKTFTIKIFSLKITLFEVGFRFLSGIS